MKFIPVDPKEFPSHREAHRGRVSYPIIKGFLESNLPMAMLDRTDIGKNAQHLKMLLGSYIAGHKLPIKLMTRRGELYMIRTNMKEDGTLDPDWVYSEDLPPDDAPGIDDDTIRQAATGGRSA